MSRPSGVGSSGRLVVGALLATVGVKAQRSLPLRVPLAEAVPAEMDGLHSENVTISPAELRLWE